MKPRSEFVFLTPAEEAKFIGVIREVRGKALVRIMLDAGLSMAETIQLKVTDLDLENKTITINGKRSRKVPINDALLRDLQKYLEVRPGTAAPELFLT